jgi:hypothetical protein
VKTPTVAECLKNKIIVTGKRRKGEMKKYIVEIAALGQTKKANQLRREKVKQRKQKEAG